MKFLSRFQKYVVCILLAAALGFPARAATLESAQQCYEDKDFKAAASEYGTLLTFNLPKAKVGDLYDKFTECLVIIGEYDLAETKIDAFISMLPNDPAAPRLSARKTQIEQLRKANTDSIAASFETAQQYYGNHDYKQAAAVYGALATQNNTASLSDVYDKLTECLVAIGKYDAAKEKIDAFVTELPDDPNCEKLFARRVQIAFLSNDFTSATQLAKGYLAKYDAQNDCMSKVVGILADSQVKCGRFQEQIDFIDQTLSSNPNHPLYAQLRRKQGDTLSRWLKQNEPARLKYVDAMDHVSSGTEIYETCAYRVSEILASQAKSIAASEPQKAVELTSESLRYLTKFVDHPGWEQIYPANAKRRLSALRKLKRFDEMEGEAARYIGQENVVHLSEAIGIKNIIGPLIDFQSGTDDEAIRRIKQSHYSDNHEEAMALAKNLMNGKSPSDSDYRKAQSLYVSALNKKGDKQALISYIDQALATDPNHPQFADYRRLQADTMYDLKQYLPAQAKYADAMAHTGNDTATYEWCCFRAGDALYREAAAHYQIHSDENARLKEQGKTYLREYVDLTIRDQIYPGNIRRRMTAFIRLGQHDLMELEAARYLADIGVYTGEDYMGILQILSTDRAMKTNPDQQGAYAAFDELKQREYNYTDVNAKVYAGITMLKSADYFADHGGPKDRVDNLRATGRKFLLDATRDETLKMKNRIDAFYFLGDWAAMKGAALVYLEKLDPSDSANRAEIMVLAGAAMAYQQDVEGALKYFDMVFKEYDKNPVQVGHRAATAAYWGVWLCMGQGNESVAKVYVRKASTLPDCDMKQKILREYARLLKE